MTLPTNNLPYGLRDIKLTPLSADGTVPTGPSVDLPASRTLSFSETEDFTELRGDDQVIASRGNGPVVEWSMEHGGISLEAYAVMAGGTVVTTGVTPNQIRRYTKLGTDSRPYFRIEGQAISDNGGDFHTVIYRAKVDGSIDGDQTDGEFRLTAVSGKGYPSLEAATVGRSYDHVANETTTAIVTANNEIQQIVIDATGGTFTATFTGQTTGAITAAGLTAGTLQTALEALSNIAPGDVAVAGGTGVFTITFMGVYANTNVAQITLATGSLTGGSAAVYTVHAGG